MNIKGNNHRTHAGAAFLRYLIIVSVVVPLVLFVMACAGSEAGHAPDSSLQDLIDKNTKCIDWQAGTSTETVNLPVDIAWVIDNSGSMAQDQTNLSNGFNSAAQALAALGINDVQMGVVTTDMFNGAQAGKLQQNSDGSLYTTDLSQASLDMFKETALVGDTGNSGFEQGGKAAFAALMRALPGGFNAGFLRDNATLAVIVLSDEEDNSDHNNQNDVGGDGDNDTDPLSAAEVVDCLVAAKGGTFDLDCGISPGACTCTGGDPNKVTMHFIGHLTSNDGCHNNPQDQVGTRYLAQQQYLASLRNDHCIRDGETICTATTICTSNYSDLVPLLIELSTDTTTTEIHFVDLSPLGFLVDPDSVKITLDNGDVVPNDPDSWTFDEANNRIILHDDSLQNSSGKVCATTFLGEE